MSSQAIRNPISKSLGLHLLLLMAAFLFVTHAPKVNTSLEPVTIDLVEETHKSQTETKKQDEAKTQQTIVQKSLGVESDKAKDKSYLSDKTRVVKDERSATQTGQVDGAGKIGNTKESTQPASQAKAQSQPVTRIQPNDIKLSDLGVKVKITPKTTPAYEQQRQWANAQTGEAIRGGQYIQGMKEGEVSALNTKEFVFYSYFDRVRKQLDQAWQPLLKEQIGRIYKNGRRLASNADYVTKTMVTLTEKGEISRVQVLEESGTFDLDQVAIDALNKAGPYPNPPKGLIDSSGVVQIRWDFVLRT